MSNEEFFDGLEAESYNELREEDTMIPGHLNFQDIHVENGHTFEELGSEDEMEQTSEISQDLDDKDIIEVGSDEIDDEMRPELQLDESGDEQPNEETSRLDEQSSHTSEDETTRKLSLEIIDVDSEPENGELNSENERLDSLIGNGGNNAGHDDSDLERDHANVELDSEEEIENLEEQYIEDAEKKEIAVLDPEVRESVSLDSQSDFSEEDEPEEGEEEREEGEDEAEVQNEEAEEEKDEEEMAELPNVQQLQDSNSRVDMATETTSTSLDTTSVPAFICICGDEFLLTPFFEPCNYKLEDMISLFSVDEVTGKTLEQLFQLLRGNGDLIDAYNFNVEDELRLDIPELGLSVTEDNVFTREMKLDDIIGCFHALRQNSHAAGEENVPDKLTVLVSMQQRFASRYGRLQKLASEQGTFGQVRGTQLEQEMGPVTKKRKLST